MTTSPGSDRPRVASFGSRQSQEPKGEFPPVVIPPIHLPAVHLQMVPVVDPALFDSLCGVIEAAVKAATLRGMQAAMQEFEDATADPPV